MSALPDLDSVTLNQIISQPDVSPAVAAAEADAERAEADAVGSLQ
jgi:hypothetical protein